ncbi:hypothetical protein AB7M69_001414 [Bradyrhizobium japonicum]
MTNHDTTDWRDALWATHASLFEGSSPFATGIGTLPVGWRELVESLCSRLAALAPEAGRAKVLRLENDGAALNVAWEASSPHGGVEAVAAEFVARATARAACTCATCGRAGARYPTGFGTLTACPLHMPRGAAKVVPNWPTIRTERTIAGGRSRIVACEVYDRGLDRFVATSAAALGINGTP